MANESEIENSSQPDDPLAAQGDASSRGRFSRFIGVVMIVVAVLLVVVALLTGSDWAVGRNSGKGQVFIALIFCLAGAAMYQKGRKLASRRAKESSQDEANDPTDDQSDSHDTYNPPSSILIGYKYFLIAALFLALISIARFMANMAWYGTMPNTVPRVASGVASIGLFVFAIITLKRSSAKWVRSLHLWINGVAVVAGLLSIVLAGLSAIPQVWGPIRESVGLYISNISRIGNVSTIDVGILVPWNFFREAPPFVFALVRSITAAVVTALHAYWWVLWKRGRPGIFWRVALGIFVVIFVIGNMLAITGSSIFNRLENFFRHMA